MYKAGRLRGAAGVALVLHLVLIFAHSPLKQKPKSLTALLDVWLPPSVVPAVPLATPAPISAPKPSGSAPQPVFGKADSQPLAAPPTSAALPNSTQAGGLPAKGGRGTIANVVAPHGRTVETRPPLCRREPKPILPAISRELGEEGIVKVRLQIGGDGAIRAAQVQQSSGYPRLDEAARKTLLQWRCQAAQRDGVPVGAELEETVVFELK